ncbi:hypothetical protein ES708_12275 [subsurface metagenome]
MRISVKAQAAAIDFIIESVVKIIPSSVDSLMKVKKLINKYSDLPMDFADATIVCLAIAVYFSSCLYSLTPQILKLLLDYTRPNGI